LIGEKDDDTVQGVNNPDNIQKQVRKVADSIYPPILWRSRVYEREGRQCVRVEIEDDGETPHFGGAARVRRGSETILATTEMFQKLIDLRSANVAKLQELLSREVYVVGDRQSSSPYEDHHPRWKGGAVATTNGCEPSWWLGAYITTMPKRDSLTTAYIALLYVAQIYGFFGKVYFTWTAARDSSLMGR
jgi:hypothetical protein